MREPRDFRPLQLYALTQRRNQGQWVYRDDEDFAKALDLMRLYAARHRVRVHGWCLMHNHGHWIFEDSSEDSISNLMRDMQSQHSRYLNQKYQKKPWMLLGPLRGRRRKQHYSPYRRTGPVNWSPRFDAVFLDRAGFPSFLRYIEANSVEAGLVKRAARWRWSSARAHCQGSTANGLLCLDRWQHLFGKPEEAASAWSEYLNAPQVEREANARRLRAMRTGSAQNRSRRWVPPELTVAAGLPSG